MRCILYLEPGEGNPLLPHLNDFMEKSRFIGINEAQQYHPHCSVTGFFELPPTAVPKDLIRTIGEIIDVYLKDRSGSFGVHVGDVTCAPSECRSGGSHESSTSVRIELATNGFRELALELKRQMKDLGVELRVKPVNHISLSYITNFPQAEEVRPPEGAKLFYECETLKNGTLSKPFKLLKYDHRPYFAAAKDHFAGVLEHASNDWKLVLHSEVHSTRLSSPHRFTPLQEWNLAGVLQKKYPDR